MDHVYRMDHIKWLYIEINKFYMIFNKSRHSPIIFRPRQSLALLALFRRDLAKSGEETKKNTWVDPNT